MRPPSSKKSRPSQKQTKADRTARYIESNQRPHDDKEIVIRTEKDAKHASQIMAALLTDRKELLKKIKKVRNIECGPGEMICMIDSGSFTHAINARKHLPKHKIFAARIGE